MTKFWKFGAAAVAASLLACGGVSAQERRGDAIPGPIDSIEDLQDTAQMVFAMVDENNDGQISQKEALDAGNLLVGGFFFRADANGDGKVTREEAQKERESLFAQRPWLRYVVETARASNQPQRGNQPQQANNQPGQANTNQQNPLLALANMLDSNNDKAIEATELRQAVQTSVQASFASADTNRDGQLSPTELNAALTGAARAVADSSFDQADTDHNGSVSQAEFEKAIMQPARVYFSVIDGNNDGQVTKQEAQTARRVAMRQFRTMFSPAGPNASRRMSRSGNPAQGGAAPAFGSPNQARPAQPAQPNPAQPQ